MICNTNYGGCQWSFGCAIHLGLGVVLGIVYDYFAKDWDWGMYYKFQVLYLSGNRFLVSK